MGGKIIKVIKQTPKRKKNLIENWEENIDEKKEKKKKLGGKII